MLTPGYPVGLTSASARGIVPAIEDKEPGRWSLRFRIIPRSPTPAYSRGSWRQRLKLRAYGES
jgi:hypothetical protein